MLRVNPTGEPRFDKCGGLWEHYKPFQQPLIRLLSGTSALDGSALWTTTTTTRRVGTEPVSFHNTHTHFHMKQAPDFSI